MRLAAQGSDARTAAGRRRALPPERPPLPEQLSSGEDGRDLLKPEKRKKKGHTLGSMHHLNY
jgi:hypothetical protein